MMMRDSCIEETDRITKQNFSPESDRGRRSPLHAHRKQDTAKSSIFKVTVLSPHALVCAPKLDCNKFQRCDQA